MLTSIAQLVVSWKSGDIGSTPALVIFQLIAIKNNFEIFHQYVIKIINNFSKIYLFCYSTLKNIFYLCDYNKELIIYGFF